MSAETIVYAVVALLLPVIGAYAYHIYRKIHPPSVTSEPWPTVPKLDPNTPEPLAALLVAIGDAPWPDNVILARPDAVALAKWCHELQVGEAAARADAVRLREQLAPWEALLALPLGFVFSRADGLYTCHLLGDLLQTGSMTTEAPRAIEVALNHYRHAQEASTHAS